MKKTLKIIPFAFAALLVGAPLSAMEHDDHDGHDHGAMQPAANQAMGMGQLHKIDAEGRTVNLTHDPIPAINWPQMTMDLPVTSRVDLESLSPGDHVHFNLKLGRDDVYRITAMEAVEMEHDMQGGMAGDGEEGSGHTGRE